jgi:translation initiation factor IF-3
MNTINENINHDLVKVIHHENGFIGILSKKDALIHARRENLDLILTNENSDPPICTIQDYGKYLFIMKKKSKKPKMPELKEIKIRPNTDNHDLAIKAKHINQFLQNNHRVKIVMVMIGRENNNIDVAKETFERFISMINNHTVETPQTKTNNQIYIQIKGVN